MNTLILIRPCTHKSSANVPFSPKATELPRDSEGRDVSQHDVVSFRQRRFVQGCFPKRERLGLSVRKTILNLAEIRI
jgi:hypothetical protein